MLSKLGRCLEMMQDPDHNLVQDGQRNRITGNHHISGDQRPSGE